MLCYILVFCELLYLSVLCIACLTVYVNCMVKPFAMCLGVFVIECDGVVEFGLRGSIG